MKAQTAFCLLFLLVACLLINFSHASQTTLLKRQQVINKLEKLLTQLKSAQIEQLSDFPTFDFKTTCEQCMQNYKNLALEAWNDGESVMGMLRYWSAAVEKCMKKHADTITPKCIEISKSSNPWEKRK